MFDIDVKVYYIDDDGDYTTYHFDEREPLCSFLYDCRQCGNIIDKIEVVNHVFNGNGKEYYNDCIRSVKLYATPTIIKKLNII